MGMFGPMIKNKLVVIMGGQKIIYRHPVKLFKTFELAVQFSGWDEKWLYASHCFRQGGKACCISYSKVGFRRAGKLLSPLEAFKLFGLVVGVDKPKWVDSVFEKDLDLFGDVSESLKT